jgi:hypothetical protein
MRTTWQKEAAADVADYADLVAESRAEEIVEDEIAFADPDAWDTANVAVVGPQ